MNISGLITDAIYTSSLNDRQSDPIVSSNYVNYGLYELPFIFDEWRDKIPFAQQFTFNDVDDLLSTDFYQVNNVDYVLNQVSSPLVRLTLTQWNETKQILTLTGVPIYFYFDELPRDILVYPPPTASQPYSFIVWGRKADMDLALTDVIPDQITPVMIKGIVYKLANRMSLQYGVPWPEEKQRELDRLERVLAARKAIDLTPQRGIVFGAPNSSKTPGFPYFYYASGGGS